MNTEHTPRSVKLNMPSDVPTGICSKISLVTGFKRTVASHSVEDVYKRQVYTDDEIVYQEVALYKVPTDRLLDEQQLEQIIRRHGARILELTRDYTVLEKTGHFYETESLFNELKRYGIVQFVRSGRVAVTKSPVELVNEYLEQRAKQSSEKF